MTKHLNEGDVVKVKFTDIFGIVNRKTLSTQGETLYEVLCSYNNWERSQTLYCRENALIILSRQKEKTFN